jgi:hypothetical protein
MWIQLLKKLELCARLRATKAEWRMRLGGDAADSLGSLLKITAGVTEALPCAHRPGCGGFHEIRELSGGRWIAVSADDERPCSPFDVRQTDLAIYRFDLDGFLVGIAETLTIDRHIDRLGPTLATLGTLTKRRVPVFLSFASTAAKHRENLAAARIRASGEFVFFLSHPCPDLTAIEREVGDCRGRSSVLTGLLEVDRRGRLLATTELTDLWPALAAEPARPVDPLRVPAGTTWADIVFHLTDRETLKVSTRTGGDHKTFTRDGLGMNNQRTKLNTAKAQWTLLVTIAQDHPNGFDQPKNAKARTDTANHVSDLNTLLARLVDPAPSPRPIRKGRKADDNGYRWDCSFRADF